MLAQTATVPSAASAPSSRRRRRRRRGYDDDCATIPSGASSLSSRSSSSSSSSPSSSSSSSLILISLLLWAPSSSPWYASSLLMSPQYRCHYQQQQHHSINNQYRRCRHRPEHNYPTVRKTIPFSFRTYGVAAHRSSSSFGGGGDDDNDDYGSEEMDIQSSIIRKSRRLASNSADAATPRRTTQSARAKPSKSKASLSSQSTTSKSTTINNNNNSRATMSTAICIVPPHHAWDTIQRARHMARDASFYRWPPAIRLFHPFVPHRELPNAAGRLASWIDTVCEKELGEEDEEEEHAGCDTTDASGNHDDNGADSSSMYLRPFEVTLDSILILPHWEILDARIEALEDGRGSGDRSRRDEEDRASRKGRQRRSGGRRQEEHAYDDNNNYYHDTDDYCDNNDEYDTVGGTQEMEYLRRKAEGTRLIEDEERKGIERKKERERKRRMREGGGSDEIGGDDTDTTVNDEYNPTASSSGGENDGDDDDDKPNNASSYNGPCVVYLSPDDASRYRLESLRERLRVELFPNFNAFSPGSSVSPYPEYLPRPRSMSSNGGGGDGEGQSKFRPLLPIGRFATVEDAVAVAKVLQSTWDPLTFNVTDIQFISRKVTHDNEYEYYDPPLGGTTSIAAPNPGRLGGLMNSDSFSGGVGFGRTTTTPVNRMAITTSGEVEDVSRQGIYGCDAMVMLWGEEPEEELMDREASLAMMMDDDDDVDDGDDDNDGGTNESEIDYGKIFATAEREYRRMQTHEILSAKNSSPSSNYLDDDDQGGETDESTSEIEAWLDDDDESLEDEGATVVIGRAQFFMGANREFVGMPASSAIDSKDRIMGGGISAVARRKGSVHRLAESWNAGDFGKKESDRRA